MAWIAPKLDWNASSLMNAADLNRIENNIKELYDYLNSIQYTMPKGNNPYALSFDGVDDYISVPSTPIGTTTFTVEVWVKPMSLPARHTIFSTRKNNPAGCWQLELGTGSTAGTNRIAVTGVGTWIIESNDNAITLNTWQHIAYVRNGGTNDKLYVNGVLQSVFSSTPSYVIIENADDRIIGAQSPTGAFLNGSIDDVRVWSTVRTQTEIQNNMNKYLLGDESGLVGYWKFNEGAGLLAADATVNKSNGSLLGGVSWVTNALSKDNQDIVKNRDTKSIDYLSSINRIENNLDAIRLAFINPIGYLGKKTWTVGKPFDYTDANRLEGNTKQLLDLGFVVYQSFRYCGTFNSGESGGLE